MPAHTGAEPVGEGRVRCCQAVAGKGDMHQLWHGTPLANGATPHAMLPPGASVPPAKVSLQQPCMPWRPGVKAHGDLCHALACANLGDPSQSITFLIAPGRMCRCS